MRLTVVILWFSLSPFFVTTVVAGQDDVAAVAARAIPSVVSIEIYGSSGELEGHGSGFVLEDGRIVTNAHVVAGAAWVEILDSEGRAAGTAPYAEAVSSRGDLAILPAMTSGLVGLPVAGESPAIGTRVVVIGSPMGLRNTVSDGLVSAVRDVDGTTLIQLSAPISAGSSGGPVIDTSGQVVGVAVAYLDSGQNLNFAVPWSDLRTLMKSPERRVALSAIASEPAVGSDEEDVVQEIIEALDVLEVLEADSVMAEELSVASGEFRDRYEDWFRVDEAPGSTVSLLMVSEDFDALLKAYDSDGLATWLQSGSDSWLTSGWEDDDGLGGTDAQLEITMPPSGQIYVVATSYGALETGSYRLLMIHGSVDDYQSDEAIAEGERWTHVAVMSGENPATIYLDTHTITELSSDRYEAWFMSVHDEPYTASNDEVYDEARDLYEVQCSRRRMQSISYTRYLDGEVVSSSDNRRPWIRPVPNSVGEGMFEAVCSR